MITLDTSCVYGRNGGTAEDMDRDTVALAHLLGWTGSDAWYAAEYLRMQYRDVLRTAGEVTLTLPATAAATVAA